MQAEKGRKVAKIPIKRAFLSGAPGVTRTPDQRIRNPLLCPAELQGHDE
jgi:hypothetical protein